MTSDSFLLLENIDKAYERGGERVTVFSGMNLAIPKGDFVAVMGPSGSGKTTLLNILGGVDRVDSGQILHCGERIDNLPEGKKTQWRTRNVAFVFQHYNLLSMLTAEQNVELPLLLTKMGRKERRQRVGDALRLVELTDRGGHLPSELSGGQQQRTAIARAIVADMPIILCDEPTGNLDKQSSDEVLEILSLLNAQFGKTIVMVTHDQHAAETAIRTVELVKGVFVVA